MRFYKKAYFVIGLIIAIVGLSLIPLLPILINEYESIGTLGINAVVIYILYLFQTIASYWFFAYKSAIIKADQKEYKVNIVLTFSTIITSTLQIIVLLIVPKLELYTLVSIIVIIIQNLVISRISKKMYPLVDERNVKPLEKKEMFSMIKDCGAVFLFKLNAVVVDATDNIVLSSLIGLSIVGLYSNYLMAVYLIKSVTGKFYNAFTASFGNLHASGDLEYEHKMFEVINFCTFFLFSVSAVWLVCNVNDFINMLLGSDYLVTSFSYNGKTIETPINILLAVEMYLFGMYSFLSRIRNATGLFREIMISPIICIVVNLVVSILLVPIIGIAGVIIGTIVSGLLTYMWIDPWIIHKKLFKTPITKYFFKNALYISVSIMSSLVIYYLISYIGVFGWLGLIIKSIVSVLLAATINTILFWKTKEMQYCVNVAKRGLNKLFKK